jgi:tetratricopeptide (TPR) repeat protein
MDTLMKVVCRAWKKSSMVAVCLLLALQAGLAQKKPVTSTPEATRTILVEKARALESRGRPDMAIQLWQQILLSDPKNPEALAGLAKDLKLIGSPEKSSEALEQLRKVNPHDPNIAKIEAMASTRAQSDQLRQAGELARQGKTDDAMRIYRELYGDRPPDGDIALAYYQTLYGTATGKEAAIGAMRSLADRNPGDPRFAVELGIMLTYDARTRAEGIRMLEAHPRDPNAQTGLRQALIWDAANPASAAQLRQYLKEHPQDTEISVHLREDESKLAQMNSGIARTPAERAAFAALNAHKLEDAQKRFAELLQEEPTNGLAAAGMGFLRMQQSNFGGAISYLTQAEQNGFKTRVVEDALTASRFWFTMGEASQAFDENQLDVAAAKYREALAQRPRSPEALIGMAGLLVKEQQYSAAAGYYDQLLKAKPGSPEAWRGLFLAYARDGQDKKALAISLRFPAPVKAAMAKDPEYLRTLATIYHSEDRMADAQRVLALALSLPFPDNGTNLKTDTKLQYAGILMEAKRFEQAGELYTQILNEDSGNLPAWMGLVSAHHELNQDNQAIADVEKMPPAAYDAALSDPGFLSMLGAIYQQANQYDIAQGLLERSAKLQIAAGGQPSMALQLQLAAIYLLRNNTAQAYEIYHQVLAAHPDRVDAWKGLIATLQVTNRTTEALDEIAQIPPAVRKELETDIEFVQGEASLYAANEDIPHAIEYMNRVQAHYATLKTQPPASVEVQNAWLLFNTGNDRLLYLELMRLGGRKDLTATQRETVQNIWANWSVRRAGAAMANGNMQRAVDILDAASQAFPDNMTVRKAVAGGYVKAGRAKESLALFKTVPMQDANAGDFVGAVGAALAANDKVQAELWLRQALERFPHDPAILALAARFEQARGDNQRAADYYRASLAAMPQTSPANRLAHQLVYPDQDEKTHRAATAADLQRLLDPDHEPFQKTTKLAPLPAYGADPYNGSAPVVLSQPQQAPLQNQWINAPATTEVPATADPGAKAGGPMAQATSAQSDTQAATGTLPASKRSRSAAKGKAASQSKLTGTMQVPAAEQKIHAQDPAAGAPAAAQANLAEALVPEQKDGPVAAVPAAPAHTPAGDAWKGLIFSLEANHRNADAFKEIAKIPPEVRRQLEADVEFEIAEANLYAASGDIPHATEYIRRIENYYLLRRTTAPAGIEVQHAWLLYNTGNERSLYPVLVRLDARQDLTAAQRDDVQTLWANWSVRRAAAEMGRGNVQGAVDILDAAAQDFPESMNVRKAVAGGYVKAGRASDALALYKAMPLQDANAGDMQGAIGAALAAKDMTQAEIWLRQALSRFPGDPGVLAVAARFEQARGDDERATEYLRASLAAMPPGQTTKKFAFEPVSPAAENGVRTHAAPGNVKQLLNPEHGPQSSTAELPALPTFGSTRESGTAPVGLTTPNADSSNPAPAIDSAAKGGPRAQGTAPGMQDSSQKGTVRPALDPQTGRPVPTASVTQDSTSPSGYVGSVHLSAAEENVDSTESVAASAPAQAPLWSPEASRPAHAANSAEGLRITSQPMDPAAARVQVLFAEQTDGQLTQGSASVIHALGNAQEKPAASIGADLSGNGTYTMAQYTPSAQEAATGAYSAPKQQPAPQQAAAEPPAQQPAKPTAEKKGKKAKKAAATSEQAVPTLATAPALETPQSTQAPELPAEATPTTTGAGLTDQELEDRNLPPLRGPWVRVQRQSRQVSPRDEAEMQLRSIESGYSPWLGGAGVLNYRSGDLGYDHLSALEAPFEASLPLGYHARLTFVAKPVFLDSGQADGTSVINVQEFTTAGSALVSIPQPIGTLTATNTTLPAQQNASGVGGEAQLAFAHLAIAGGYTPAGFLVATFTARAQWKPANGPFTLSFSRDPVKDTQLSYAGLRDPAGNTLGNQGQVWGGVVADQGNVQFSHGNAESGFYLGAGGQYLNGYTVEKNNRVDGSGGAYWRLLTSPENGNLSIGTNFFGMHYAHNEDAFTHGMGGYFSPNAYFLANVPFTWVGHYETRWHYNILGSLGVQAFQEDSTPLWPLAVDKPLETAMNNPMLPAKTSVGPNYDLRGQASYQISPHWFAGGFFGANNSRNYTSVSTGFYVRYLFRPQPSTATAPTGIFPTEGLRPFSVP